MKYVVEINGDTEKGSRLIRYIEELDAPDSDVHIVNEPPLTDEEMAMPPTRRVSEATLDEWLRPSDDEEGFTIKESVDYIEKRMQEMRDEKKKNEGKNNKTSK